MNRHRATAHIYEEPLVFLSVIASAGMGGGPGRGDGPAGGGGVGVAAGGCGFHMYISGPLIRVVGESSSNPPPRAGADVSGAGIGGVVGAVGGTITWSGTTSVSAPVSKGTISGLETASVLLPSS